MAIKSNIVYVVFSICVTDSLLVRLSAGQEIASYLTFYMQSWHPCMHSLKQASTVMNTLMWTQAFTHTYRKDKTHFLTTVTYCLGKGRGYETTYLSPLSLKIIFKASHLLAKYANHCTGEQGCNLLQSGHVIVSLSPQNSKLISPNYGYDWDLTHTYTHSLDQGEQ